jgi:squalene-associated FAD-dependent desaturase
MRVRIAVVGGGLAGITAALRCADAGAEVTLYESRRILGGLTHSFRRGGLAVDNGQHVFLRCCTAYLALLDRLGVADQVTLQPRLRIPVHRPGDPRPALLRRTDLPAPLHLAGSVLAYRPLSPRERLRFAGAGLALRRLDPGSPQVDRDSFGAWLRRHGQSDAAIGALWDLVGIATLNARADQASLALAATVFQQGLLTKADAADIGWSRVPLGRLHGEAALAALDAAGARVLTGTPVRKLRPDGAGWRLRAAARGTDEELEQAVDGVVLATPPAVTDALFPGRLGLPADWAGRLGSTPIINVHAVFDRRVTDEPFLAGVGTDVQWVFDRTEASGLGEGQYLAMSLSAADELVDEPTERLRQRFLPALAELLPAAADAGLRDFFVTRERTATFRQAPGSAALRPAARTALPGVSLAGAWTATGWPATMEGAVRSGDAAATALLEQAPSPVPRTPEGVVA